MAGGVCATIAYLIGSHPLNDSAHYRANAALGSRGRPSRPRRQAGGLLPRDADQAAGEAAKPRQRAKRKTASAISVPNAAGVHLYLIANAASVHGTTIPHRGPPSNAYRDESLTIPQGVRMVPLGYRHGPDSTVQ